jgi:hypothetical protein
VKRLSDQTLYEIIEVSVDAPAEEIARACDRAAATYGPGSLATYTLAAPEETALLSSRIEEARAVLLDPSARSRYDERIGVRRASPPPESEPGVRTEPPSTPAPPSVVPAVAPTPWPPPAPEPVAPDARHVPVITPAPVEPAPVALDVPAPPQEVAAVPAVAAPPPAPAVAPPAPIQLTVQVRVEPAGVSPGPVEPIRLAREVAAPLPPVVPEGSAWTGEMLRRIRESRGFTVAQLAERTRVTRHHLENIEQDRFAALPAPVYLRGIIMSLARELRLDGQKVARSYLDRMGSPAEGEPRRP